MKSQFPSEFEPLVSVVITSYNYGCYISDSIQSVLGQTYGNIEIIVVDDGSTDESRDVISGFGERVISLYRDHQGQCAAINAGFEAAKGDIIIFLDADDCLISDAVDRFVDAFRNNRSISKSQGYMIGVDANGRRLGRKIPHLLSPSGNYKNAVLNKGPWMCFQSWTSGNAWARWFIEQVFPLPEDPDNKVFPDGCLNPLAVLYGPIVTLEEPVTLYRIHDRNNGPIGTEFTVPSLSMVLTRNRNNFRFAAQRAQRIGIDLPLEYWLKWKMSWKRNLMAYAISLMDPSQKPPRFHEVVLAPLVTRKPGIFKATRMSLALVVIWFMPRKYALRATAYLLGIPYTGDPDIPAGPKAGEHAREQ